MLGIPVLVGVAEMARAVGEEAGVGFAAPRPQAASKPAKPTNRIKILGLDGIFLSQLYLDSTDSNRYHLDILVAPIMRAFGSFPYHYFYGSGQINP